MATLSRFLTRRFGIVGGLSLFAVLALTEGGAILAALLEEAAPEAAPGTVTTTAGGLTLTDVRVGGGGSPSPGDFLGLQLSVSTVSPEGETVWLLGGPDSQRKAAFVFNKARRATDALRGLEAGVAGMRRGGVREVRIPAGTGLGVAGVAGLPGGPSPFPLIVLVKLEEVTPSYLG